MDLDYIETILKNNILSYKSVANKNNSIIVKAYGDLTVGSSPQSEEEANFEKYMRMQSENEIRGKDDWSTDRMLGRKFMNNMLNNGFRFDETFFMQYVSESDITIMAFEYEDIRETRAWKEHQSLMAFETRFKNGPKKTNLQTWDITFKDGGQMTVEAKNQQQATVEAINTFKEQTPGSAFPYIKSVKLVENVETLEQEDSSYYAEFYKSMGY